MKTFFKSIFILLLAYSMISLSLGEDLDYQLDRLNDKYDVDIQASTGSFFDNIFTKIGEIFNFN